MDYILRSLFLDDSLWAEVIAHGVRKGIPTEVLEYIQDPHGRADLCLKIGQGSYVIQPPHTGYCPKEDGGERTFFVNKPLDRILLNAIYKWLMRNEKGMVHAACQSYQEGIGTGKIVRNLSERIATLSGMNSHKVVGRKFDIHKYFDTIGREHIHHAFDLVEARHGASAVIRLLRNYYDSDVYFDSRKKQFVEAYQGIKQGCAVSSWLANVILFELDREVAALGGDYVRYSDDIIYVGENYEHATQCIVSNLSKKGLQLNSKKIEDVVGDAFIRFLGYNIRGREITLSQKWVKNFQENIDRVTVKNKHLISSIRTLRKSPPSEKRERQLMLHLRKAERSVMRFLYWGNGEYGWGQLVLGVINRKADIEQLNRYCLDALRAVYTGQTSIGGLGASKTEGIKRGTGKHVAMNRRKTAHLYRTSEMPEGWLEGYFSITAMQKLMGNKWLYRALVAHLLTAQEVALYTNKCVAPKADDTVTPTQELETRYADFLNSRPDGKQRERFYAKTLKDMNTLDLLCGKQRHETREALEAFIHEQVNYDALSPTGGWYWQSPQYPQLILLRDWFHYE